MFRRFWFLFLALRVMVLVIYCPEYTKIDHSNFHIILDFTRLVRVLCFITYELVITSMFTFILNCCHECMIGYKCKRAIRNAPCLI
jgi:hypothetical protein